MNRCPTVPEAAQNADLDLVHASPLRGDVGAEARHGVGQFSGCEGGRPCPGRPEQDVGASNNQLGYNARLAGGVR